MSDYPLARFADCVGDAFDVVGAPGTAWTLAEATGHGEVADPASHGSFSLLFRGAPEPVFAQQTVTLHHPAIGDQTIFVVPIAADAAGVSYEAVFN
jgi:hypothetical protein